MADVIKIPCNFFEYEVIKEMDDEDVLLYLHMLCETHRKHKKGVFSIGNMQLTDEVLSQIFRYNNIGKSLNVLEEAGLIIREETRIKVIKVWIDKHDRNSTEYKQWRIEVFTRDGFKCTNCGTANDIQAHHIKHWKDNKRERYEVSNGLTLCRKCHLEAHNGRWY